MIFVRTWGFWLTLAVIGCGGRALNVGSTENDPNSSAPTGPVWNGTIDGAQLQDGSNRLTMTLSLPTDGSATGTVLLGDGNLLPPPKDPDIGYPPGVQFSIPGGPLGFFEGFRYPITDANRTKSSLTFRLVEFDLWAQWCSLQTKTYVVPGYDADAAVVYGCAPNVSFSSDGSGSSCFLNSPTGGEETPVDCGKQELCSNSGPPCECSATSCWEKETGDQIFIDFDLAVVGSHADGTISGALGDHPVHFVRAQ